MVNENTAATDTITSQIEALCFVYVYMANGHHHPSLYQMFLSIRCKRLHYHANILKRKH